MADYQDVQVARRLVRLINGPDFTLINSMLFIVVIAVIFVSVKAIFV
jgi:hypothetical protein